MFILCYYIQAFGVCQETDRGQIKVYDRKFEADIPLPCCVRMSELLGGK